MSSDKSIYKIEANARLMKMRRMLDEFEQMAADPTSPDYEDAKAGIEARRSEFQALVAAHVSVFGEQPMLEVDGE